MSRSRHFSPLPASRSGTDVADNGSAPHLFDRLAIVFRHGRLIAAIFAAVVALTMLESYSATPLYRAQARIVIQDERSAAITTLSASDPTFWQDPEPYFNTQYRILQSRGLARRVLRTIPPPPSSGPRALSRLIGLPAQLTMRLGASQTSTPGAEPNADEGARETAHAGAFLGGLEILPVKGTRLVEIIYTSPDRGYAALAANALAREYVQQNLDLKLLNTQATLQWLDTELQAQRRKVEDAERAVANYQEGQNAMSLDNRQNIVVARLNALNDAVTRAKTTRLQKEALHRQLDGVTADSPGVHALPAMAQSTTVQDVKGQLAQLSAEKARLRQRLQEGHPEIQKLNAQMDAAASRLRTEMDRVLGTLGNDYRAALAEEQSLSASLDDQKRQAIELNRKSISHSILQREAEGERHVYNALLQQEKELRVVSNSRANNVQVMDEAEAPIAPFTPNHGRDWLMAIVIGLALGVAAAYTLEHLNDTVKTPDDVAAKLRIPLLGLVPATPKGTAPVLAPTAPHEFGEAFRSLRTSLVFTSDNAEGSRILGITSSQPQEGKTTTAANVAIALAVGGARVLLVDADMRRPGVHRTLDLPNDVGLSHVLTGQARVREAIQRMAGTNLAVMTAGHTPPNPSELLSSSTMADLVAHLETGPFDWVIIDTPPILAVTDAAVVSRYTSGMVFVVGAEMTRRGHALRAMQMIEQSGTAILGGVLNRVDLNRNRYYYARYYGYHYQSYYAGEPPASRAAA